MGGLYQGGLEVWSRGYLGRTVNTAASHVWYVWSTCIQHAIALTPLCHSTAAEFPDIPTWTRRQHPHMSGSLVQSDYRHICVDSTPSHSEPVSSRAACRLFRMFQVASVSIDVNRPHGSTVDRASVLASCVLCRGVEDGVKGCPYS